MLFTKNVPIQSAVYHCNQYKPMSWIQVLDQHLKMNHSDKFCELNESTEKKKS